MEIYETLNDILVKLFKDIMTIEEKAIITEEFKDITNNDMHVIEAIGVDEARNMSTVSKLMSVTMGTLTIAINGLVNKGYVNRTRSEADKRVVFVSLTEKGKKAYNHHAKFHKDMIEAIVKRFDEKDIGIVVEALGNLLDFFKEWDSGKQS